MKNKIISGFVALSVAFLGGTAVLQEKTKMPSVSIRANAAETYGDLTYIVGNNGTIKITDCNESATEVIIPAEIDGIAVTIIEKDAFKKCKLLTSVTIPNGIISIGDLAFYACSSLTSVTIPDSVTNIGEEAFAVCSKLTSVKIPNGIKNIGTFAFNHCKELTSIVIPDSVTNIESYAFGYCENLTEIKLSENLTSIGYCAFKECKSLKSITIPRPCLKKE